MDDYSEQLKKDQERQRQAEELLQKERLMIEKLLRLGRRLLLLHLQEPQSASLAQIERVLNVSAKLASLLASQAAQRPQPMAAELAAHIEESQIALHKIYGEMLKSGIVPDPWEQINRERATYGKDPDSIPRQPATQPPPADQPPGQPPQHPNPS